MNREIKFRGQRIDTKEWVYGCLVNNMWTYSELTDKKGQPVYEIITGNYEGDNCGDIDGEENCIVEVIAETVGQFTGLYDKNGKEIYEGDIIQDDEAAYQIEWANDACAFDAIRLEDGSNMIGFGCYMRDVISDIIESSKLIGNIYEHQHLLK